MPCALEIRYIKGAACAAGQSFTVAADGTGSVYTVNANSDQEQVYACSFRAGTCVDISPKYADPRNYPLCRREHMRKDKALLKTAAHHEGMVKTVQPALAMRRRRLDKLKGDMSNTTHIAMPGPASLLGVSGIVLLSLR